MDDEGELLGPLPPSPQTQLVQQQQVGPRQAQPAWAREAAAFYQDARAAVVEGVGEVVRGAGGAAIEAATVAEGVVSRLQEATEDGGGGGGGSGRPMGALRRSGGDAVT